ncbi:MAG: 1-(5-phosphoribosyl)-5-[(5-phosphoribosylamino)methylideneamino]imidazole-4-carboxamide isomerase [Desulfomonile tiedjei]|nr:1-(5-phosphoribosyl)-5-[(5-phosphoribosylamino)methylideneamino]imidazole-4-carboxamide isomerase [Desulfomonile tiedjei]
MIIIPAIDLKDGKCVRLRQGKMELSTVFNEDPAAQARRWEELGASRIHVVDLDGSVGGKPANLRTVKQIAEAVRVPIQLGGGIRSATTIAMYLDAGISCVILGTIAAKEPETVKDLISRFPNQVAIGIDARSGKVAVEGWTESADVTAVELALQYKAVPPVAFIYTDIDKDGMMQGPNAEATGEFARSVAAPVILSGGISGLDDVAAVLPLAKDGVMGIIIGRALYEGKVDLREAIRLAEEANAR